MYFYTQHRVAPRHPVPTPWFNSAPLPSDFCFLTSALSFTYFQPLTNCPRLATPSVPLSFQQVTTINFCNSFLLITIQIAPGWVYPPAAIGLKFYFKSLASDSRPSLPASRAAEFRVSHFELRLLYGLPRARSEEARRNPVSRTNEQAGPSSQTGTTA
jgi:hypothetical protein